MKTAVLLVLAGLGVATVQCLANVRAETPSLTLGNESPPGSDLRGETVYVLVGETESRVEAVYDISDFAKAAEHLLFPLFGRADANPKDVLAWARFRVSFDGKALTGISLTKPPEASPPTPAELQVVWARINTGPAFATQPRANSGLALRIAYVQPHIDGRFYYLPQSLPIESSEVRGISWRYSLIARSPDLPLGFSVGESRWERLGDILVVYLKQDQIVMIQPMNKPAGR